MTTTRRRFHSLLAVAVVVTAVTACGDAGSPDDADDTIPTSTTVPDDTVPDETVPVATGNIEGWPVASALIEAAVDDLMATVGVGRDEITILRAEPVTWRSGAIGCPLPDRSYTQALVDGYRIELAADGGRYWYHGSGDGDPFLCPDPVDPAPGGSTDR